MKRKFRQNKKAMSIVISTVIIIAISITMSIAVAFWAMGLGNSFTKFEKLEFISSYANDQPINYNIGGTTVASATTTLTTDGTGAVANIIMSSFGAGYTSMPTITISAPPTGGVRATAHAVPYATTGTGSIVVLLDTPGSGYLSAPTVTISNPPPRVVSCYTVYLQIKNTGSAAASINNIFLDGKPYNLNAYQLNLIDQVIPVGTRLGLSTPSILYLPVGGTWNRGDYVEVEIQTNAGRTYSTTVLIP
jgi:archaeal type IV pilus assembly protein PilA